VKTKFGSWWHRFARGGVSLEPVEQRLLEVLREHMPTTFHASLDAQLRAINLAQRQSDWRGLNLYRLRWGKVFRDDLPPLPCKAGEVKLLSVRVVVPKAAQSVHVVFWAVDRFFFGFATGESLEPIRSATEFELVDVKQSWRSNAETAH
jgi:hypothetical protein